MSKKKIVFAAIRAGGGHEKPAEVIIEALHSLYPGKYELTLLDFMKDLGCHSVDSRHKRSWRWMLAHPLLTKTLQLLSQAGGALTRLLLALFISPFYAYLRRYLEAEKPDLVVSTHFLNTLAISRVRRRHALEVGLINCLTEIFDCNAYWFLRDVDHYLISTERVWSQMTRRHFPVEKLHLFSYPVPVPRSFSGPEAAEIRKSLGVDIAQQTLLISFGGEGIGPLEHTLARLVKLDLPLNIIVLCARNSKLKKKLELRFSRGSRATRVIPLGYITYVQKVIYISDFCFIKPGPATTWEIMTYRKPILFTRSAQLSEEKVLRFACDMGIACRGGNRPKTIVRKIREMMNRDFQEACQKNYGKLDLGVGAADIARFIDSTLRNNG